MLVREVARFLYRRLSSSRGSVCSFHSKHMTKLAEDLGYNSQTVSKFMSLLVRLGMVLREIKRGKTRYYVTKEMEIWSVAVEKTEQEFVEWFCNRVKPHLAGWEL